MNCRLCSSARFRSVLNLGQLALTGRFVSISDLTPEAPVHLVSCIDCGMFQLENSCPAEVLYGPGYGYESHLNSLKIQQLSNSEFYLNELVLNEAKQNLEVIEEKLLSEVYVQIENFLNGKEYFLFSLEKGVSIVRLLSENFKI